MTETSVAGSSKAQVEPRMDWLAPLPVLAAWAVIVSGLTALAVKLVGRALSKRSRPIAILVCGAIVPATVLGLDVLQISTAPTLPPPNDGPAMVFIGIVAFGLLAVPFSFATSGLLLFRLRSAD